MLMIMWLYRVVFANFVFFASTGVLFVIGMFMLKRGIYSHRPKLRKGAFAMIFLAAFKAFMIDIRAAKEYLLCDALSVPVLSCTNGGMMAADFLGIVLFLLSALFIVNAYRNNLKEKKLNNHTPEEVHLRFWANLSLWMIIAMICWLAAPWFGFLTVGYVPQVFMIVPWQFWALANLAALLKGFWQSESCAWSYNLGQKDKMHHLNQNWTPRDTLWLNVFLYVIALVLCYVSADILEPKG